MRRVVLVVLVVLVAAFVPFGGVYVATKVAKGIVDRRRVRLALREAAVKFNLDPDFLEAIGYVESRWNVAAVNRAGRDGERGGAWGPTQITERTAREHGYTGPIEEFTRDAELAATWTGRILRAASDRRHLETLADYVAAWNAGRDDADRNNDGELEELRPDHPTRSDYLPRAVAALELVRGEPVT